MLGAKSAAPCPESSIWLPPALTQTTNKAITLFTTPPGYLVTSNLVDKLSKQGREIFWLRIGPEDCDPGFLLLSLANCFQRVGPDILPATLANMRQAPGPYMGWLPLFEQLSQDIFAVLPSPSVIILEHLHFLCEYPSTLTLLANSFLTLIPKHFPCILLTHQALPTHPFSDNCTQYQKKDLAINELVGRTLASYAGIDIPDNCIHQVVEISNGRMGALNCILFACNILGSAYTWKIIKSANTLNNLLEKLAQEFLVAIDQDVPKILALTRKVGYWHPDISQAALSKNLSLNEPWKQSLEASWERLHCLWTGPTQSSGKIILQSKRVIYRKVANYLSQQGDISVSLKLFFELKDYEQAGQILAKHSRSMMDLGQWISLERWIGELPRSTLHNYPSLVYLKAELAVANGHINEARKTFALANRIFSKREQAAEVCQSNLAEATLAAWQGEVEKAQICLQNAEFLAQSQGLKQELGWINWTRSCFTNHNTNPDDTLSYLNQTQKTLHDPTINELQGQIKLLIQKQQDVRQEQNQLRQAYLNLSQTDHEIEKQLSSLLEAPQNLSKFLSAYGWTGTPMVVKILSGQKISNLDGSTNNGLPYKLKEWMKNLFDGNWRLKRALAKIASETSLSEDGTLRRKNSTNPHTSTTSRDHPALERRAIVLDEADEIPKNGAYNIDQTLQADPQTSLSANFLGPFRISLNNQLLSDQFSGRGQAIFKYMLFHHNQEQHREVLMTTFWPDATPNAARNNLNVALHNIRSFLRTVTDIPIIEFHNNAYRFNSDLNIQLDIDAFEQHVQAGQQYEQSKQIELAINEYEISISLYQDDFLLDDPYEEWTLAPRERLRIAYLSALGQLSRINFSQKQYAPCIVLCQHILDRDNCREDTHCLLMRCYSRMGQRSLALRQYQACQEALQSELGVSPEIETQKLAECIRNMRDI